MSGSGGCSSWSSRVVSCWVALLVVWVVCLRVVGFGLWLCNLCYVVALLWGCELVVFTFVVFVWLLLWVNLLGVCLVGCSTCLLLCLFSCGFYL